VARIIERNPAAAVERRKKRRALTIDQGRRLLEVCGPRRLRYSIHLWAGLRVSETGALQWRNLDLDPDGDRPCIRLRAETTKSKRADELPLHTDLAEALRDAKPPFAKPTDRVFKTTPILRTLKPVFYSCLWAGIVSDASETFFGDLGAGAAEM